MIMGGVELHQQLKDLCVNTNWKYAVFWKVNHQDQMTLTCEDAYCDNLRDSCISNDLLGLEVLKMSYSVYSIGEGMVGGVAASGKHVWKSGQQLVNGSLDEHLDGWRTQFRAGIRTVVVIAVAPYGVVQLGSLYNIAEDLKLVNRIREIFFNLQQCSLIASADSSPCVTDLSTTSSSGRFHNHINNKDKTMKKNMSNTRTTLETINNHQENQDPISDFTQLTHYNDQNQNLFIPKTSNHQIPDESLKFPTGCELYEALGPAFCKQKQSFEWDPVATTETLTVDKMREETSGSIMSTSEHLLEAVVAKGGSVVHPSASDLLTGGSVCNSFDMTTNFEARGRVDWSREPPVKVGKKRARAGQSGKSRPRDRQLIQDRIKELRQLVPNGSKCSIDSLLGQTIKHMLFMQSVTKHTDKFDEFKLLGKEKGVQRPRGHEQGSSWAMEVGNDLKLCPIIVENVGVNGKMLIEMMCDECVQFLEITEAIRSLGLTILKGVTDVYGDKTWMCFVVEGENNRNIHRVDILLSLIHILELKANA